MSRRRWMMVLTLPIFLGMAMIGWGTYARHYPYGYSHSCDKQLLFALLNYADNHGGAFPVGKESPQASFALLYPDYAPAYLLAGQSFSESDAKSILDAGGHLTAEQCSWHYVEGLRKDDDSRFALFWDRLGLGHWGNRHSPPGRTVFFVSGSSDVIADSDWEKFLDEQNGLWREKKGVAGKFEK